MLYVLLLIFGLVMVDTKEEEVQAGEQGVKPEVRFTNLPSIPTYSGQLDRLSEVSYEVWENAVESLLADGTFSSAVVKQVIRRSLRGQAAELLVHVPVDSEVFEWLKRLRSCFARVVSQDVAWQDYYSARQLAKESVASWWMRLEGLLSEADRDGEVDEEERNAKMRIQFWTRLFDSSIKEASRHVYDTSDQALQVFQYCRVLESSKPAMGNVSVVESVESSRLSKLEEQVAKVTSLVEKLCESKRGKCYLCGSPDHWKRECPRSGAPSDTHFRNRGQDSSQNLSYPARHPPSRNHVNATLDSVNSTSKQEKNRRRRDRVKQMKAEHSEMLRQRNGAAAAAPQPDHMTQGNGRNAQGNCQGWGIPRAHCSPQDQRNPWA
jgi:hypothetical protein